MMLCHTARRILFVASLAVPAAVQAQTGKPVSSFRDCADVCPELVTLPSGKFMMGADSEEGLRPIGFAGFDNEGDRHTPAHAVTVRQSFAIGKYPVTREEFSAFVRETGYRPRNCENPSTKEGYSWNTPAFAQTPRDPVICVSWYDAQAYVKWLGKKTGHDYRLPTEAQWEFAARAGTTATFYWGEDWKQPCRYANFWDDMKYDRGANYSQFFIDREAHCRDGFRNTSPVGSFLPNAFGLYDMAGNVNQWMQDCRIEDYKSAPADDRALASGACDYRALRGGSYASDPVAIRPASRKFQPPAARAHSIGFRVVRIR